MKLIDLIETLNTIDEELIIYIENKNDVNSNIVLSRKEEGDNGIKVQEGKKYYYLIEVFLAKEFTEDWIESLNSYPSKKEIAERIYKYAMNDA